MTPKKKTPTLSERVIKLEKEFAEIRRILKRMEEKINLIIKRDLEEIKPINDRLNAPIIRG